MYISKGNLFLIVACIVWGLVVYAVSQNATLAILLAAFCAWRVFR